MSEDSGCATEGCRSCGSTKLSLILELGKTPLADGLVSAERTGQSVPRYPLDVVVCLDCWLMQLTFTVTGEELYCRDYPYYSSVSAQWLEHSKVNAQRLISEEGLTASDLVVEVASNDGYLLRNFVSEGIPVLGIDPASGPALAAEAIGVPTRQNFFSLELAQQLRSEGKAARVIVANNVLAHATRTNDFVAGIEHLLHADGVASLEFPSLIELIQKCEFDTIYHEHLCYFSLTSVRRLFHRHGLIVHHVDRLSTHGGSLRVHVSHDRVPSMSVKTLLEEEAALGVDTITFYDGFRDRVRSVCDSLRELLEQLKRRGATIAAYGAAAKGATLLNVAGIGSELVSFVVDKNPHKHGRLMPGGEIPIVATEELLRAQPDFALLLAWNFKDEILGQQAEFIRQGGRFIVPIPEPAILAPAASAQRAA